MHIHGVSHKMLPYLLHSDINECEDTLIAINCTQKCINIFGSYECGCYDGYQITSDTMECIGNASTI